MMPLVIWLVVAEEVLVVLAVLLRHSVAAAKAGYTELRLYLGQLLIILLAAAAARGEGVAQEVLTVAAGLAQPMVSVILVQQTLAAAEVGLDCLQYLLALRLTQMAGVAALVLS